MGKARKERYEFKFPGQEQISACNIYLLRADEVYYFGFEDIGEGVTVSYAIKFLSKYVMKRYKLDPYNAFFFKWYTRYQNRGVEQIEFEWKKSIPQTPSIKKFCDYNENPFM